jgi:hypothetical protein
MKSNQINTIVFALRFLKSNLEEDVLEDLVDSKGCSDESSIEEIENIFQKLSKDDEKEDSIYFVVYLVDNTYTNSTIVNASSRDDAWSKVASEYIKVSGVSDSNLELLHVKSLSEILSE